MDQTNPYRYVGCQLKNNVYSPSGVLLIKEGVILSEKLIDKLERININIEDFQDDITPVIEDHLLSPFKQQLLVDQAVEEMKDIFSEVKGDPKVLLAVEENILPVVRHLALNYNLSTLVSGLQSKDDYTYRHNLGVSVISTLIAKWLKLSEREVEMVSIGGILHDIGKIEIPIEILNKPGPLLRSEFNKIKEHTTYGYNILKKSEIFPEEICLMALEHHEREEGQGYPHKKNRDQISYYSKIIAVADMFHAMMSDRVYSKGFPLYDVLKIMAKEAYGSIDTKITNLFIQRIMEMAIGNKVYLSNGLCGEIVFVDKKDPINPVIRIGSKIYDLRLSNLYVDKFAPIPLSATS